MTMKPCLGPCGETKPLPHFRKDPKSPDGYGSVCRVCRTRADRARQLERKYGITLDDYGAMLEQQGHRCAICLKRPRSRLQVDHCHRTGAVRGLLCGKCNRAVGLLRDDPQVITRAADHVARNRR